jgi:hypothetical protein
MSGFFIEINFIAILNTILFNIFTLPVKRYLAMNTIVTWLKFNAGMNFMKVHAFLLKGWFSSVNSLCELVSNRKSSSPSSSVRESVTSTCYPRFKNMKWFWQDKHGSRLFFLWQAALLEEPWLHLKWLHFRLTLIPLLISPTPLIT